MINDYQGVVVFLCPSLICLWLISFRCLFHQSLLCHFSGSRCCPPQGQGVLTDSWVQHLDTGLCPHHYSWSSHAGPLSDGNMNSHLLLEWYFFKKTPHRHTPLPFLPPELSLLPRLNLTALVCCSYDSLVNILLLDLLQSPPFAPNL